MMVFIHEAGWGIYPVLAFGIAALIVALKQLLAPKQGRATTAAWLMALTGVAGLLGTATGLQSTAYYVHDVQDKWIFVAGLRESLNNMVAAGVFVALAMLAMLVAHVRAGGQREAKRVAATA